MVAKGNQCAPYAPITCSLQVSDWLSVPTAYQITGINQSHLHKILNFPHHQS